MSTARAPLRLFVAGAALAPGLELELPAGAAAHVKVRRLQPGDGVHLFDGRAAVDWPATIVAITRGTVWVRMAPASLPAAAELPFGVELAFVMPANERMDALVEKASELGAAALWPLVGERSVLRLADERAERRRVHWQAVAAAACEQCGRAVVPHVHAVQPLLPWLAALPPAAGAAGRFVLSTQADAPALADLWAQRSLAPRTRQRPEERALPASPRGPVVAAPETTKVAATAALFLSGPEGGFAPAELAAAAAAGFVAASLGPRVLRADTAPLAVLAWLGVELARTRRSGGPGL